MPVAVVPLVDAPWDVAGRRVVVTGSTQGLGRETARQLAARGAHVVLACRDLKRAEAVAEEIRQQHPGAQVEVGPQLDLGSLESVRRFAAAYKKKHRELHVLVNNAGTNYLERWFTPEGVGGLCQVNYLGPYTLTRLLEDTLQASAPSRVVNVSSVTHRFGWVGDVAGFLASWRPGSYYPSTKLANALFAFELQRRLGEQGVQSCAVDPGGVASNIWSNSAFARPPLSWVIGNLYAPPSDGAAAVVHAASVPWGRERRAAAAITAKWGGAATPSARAQALPDLRFYARGLFASPAVTSWRGVPRRRDTLDKIRSRLWGLTALAASLLDWPLRNLSGGRLLSTTRVVPAAPLAYDANLAAQLWDLSADATQVPRQPRLLANGK
ncbi:short-chain dehydrogenase [Micractinium conductrix]|uniref:Short-chain dehydrogenase n=1 Tax=Micractinium conductrix TaxID=554055 RepID=A0A2P6VIY4_9CHLO|nr:short-chain dehydrogenase [Micractinium conductrix]|eukprot:PSC74044.1 short-chain dehydrogenase [Micractinium conductrix]